MASDQCGSSLFLSLPDDVFAIVSRPLSVRDLCNLSLCCRNLYDLAFSEKVWLSQCEMVGVLADQDLVEWRTGVSSYSALFRFLVSVQPLIGTWVHQHPALGNVVYVMPGFLSVVGCRIIPQQVGPLGLHDGPILWAPVFEIVSESDGSAAFFLHGREKDTDYLYPGLFKPVDRACNVLSLEVEQQKHCCGGKLLHTDISRSEYGISESQRLIGTHKPVVPFSKLAFGDQRKLLDVVTNLVRVRVPDMVDEPLFPGFRNDELKFQKYMLLLSVRRSMLMRMYRLGEGRIDWESTPGLPSDPIWMEMNKIRKTLIAKGDWCSPANVEESDSQSTKRRTVAGYFMDSLKQILGRSSSINDPASSRNSTSSSEAKYAKKLQEFLRSGDTIGLSLHACTMKLSTYRAWAIMPDNRFALYKLPMRMPIAGEEYSGLWGGTFGWHHEMPAANKAGKALFFLLLSYEESEGQRLLIATKILEGTHYALHPNGSAMFIVRVGEPSSDPFPWDEYADSTPVEVKHAYNGEGITNGYSFSYTGSLFVIQNEVLVFIWKDSKTALTLQRLDLQSLLKKGERVPALPPVANFSYLTPSYSNVFGSFCLSSSR